MNGVLDRWERSWLEPPCPNPQYVPCAWCGGELLDEDALQDGEHYYCDEDCKVQGPYDFWEEYWMTRFGS